jgi:hypothetical protein
MKRNRQKSSDSLNIGIFVMFLALAFLAVYLYVNKNEIFRKNITGKLSQTATEKSTVTQPDLEWDEYKNEEFEFSLEHPNLLYKREFRDQGSYKLFIRFEENKFSIEKGLALGISGRTKEEELAYNKESLTQAGAKLVNVEKITVYGQEATRLDFEPQGEGEKRSVVVFSRGDYSYSISTVPEQIGRVVESFKFII